MKTTPIISVIIPTYNHSNYITEALKSVFAQTFTDYEVIVVNDGSADNTSEILKPYNDSGLICYFEQNNLGQAAARNFGLKNANGSYIAFLDDDDFWPVDKLEIQLNRFKNNDSLVAVAGYSRNIKDGILQETDETLKETDYCFEDFFDGSPFLSPGQVLIAAKIIKNINGFDEEIWGADDLDLWMRLSKYGKIVKYPDIVLSYRMHNENNSLQTSRMLVNCRKVIFKNASNPDKSIESGLKRKAYRWLFDYLGVRIIINIKSSVKRCRIIPLFTNLKILIIYFFIPSIKDYNLSRNILKSLFSNKFFQKIISY